MTRTRVFKRHRSPGSWHITLSLSFKSKADAESFSRDVDRLKARAACNGYTLSDEIQEAIHDHAEVEDR